MTVPDASVVVSMLTVADVNHRVSARWFQAWEATGGPFDVAPILLIEVAAVIARLTGSPLEGYRAVRTLRRVPRLRFVDLDDVLHARAIRFAADLHLRGADAVYVATAHLLGVPLVTWDDQQMQRAAAVIDVRKPTA